MQLYHDNILPLDLVKLIGGYNGYPKDYYIKKMNRVIKSFNGIYMVRCLICKLTNFTNSKKIYRGYIYSKRCQKCEIKRNKKFREKQMRESSIMRHLRNREYNNNNHNIHNRYQPNNVTFQLDPFNDKSVIIKPIF